MLIKNYPNTIKRYNKSSHYHNCRRTSKDPKKLKQELNMKEGTVWTVNATKLAMQILGRAITNTAMLGVVARSTGIVEMDSIEQAVNDRFPTPLAEKNMGVIKEAYKEARFE